MPKKLPRQFCFAKISKYQPEQICQAVWNSQKYLVTWEDGSQATLYEKELLSELDSNQYEIVSADIRYHDFGDNIVRVVMNKDGTCTIEQKNKWFPTHCKRNVIEYANIEHIWNQCTHFYQFGQAVRELVKQVYAQPDKKLQHTKYDWISITHKPGVGYTLSAQEPILFRIGSLEDLTAFLIENKWDNLDDWFVTDVYSLEEKQLMNLVQALHTTPDVASNLLDYLNRENYTDLIGILPTKE